MITQSRLKELLNYDLSSGVFIWNLDSAIHKSGDVAGIKRSNGYSRICVDGTRYESHRLAWLFVYGKMPVGVIDHINGNPLDNSIVNLRECTQAQNAKNFKIKSVNTSGFTGVSFDKSRNKWIAQGRYNGKKKNLGRFETKEQAAIAYASFAKSHYGEFYRNPEA
jgi:hypothetical protein